MSTLKIKKNKGVAPKGNNIIYLFNLLRLLCQVAVFERWNRTPATTTKTTPTAIGLCEGTYTCLVTDMAGCEVSASFTVTEPAELIADIIVTQAIDCYGYSTGTLADNTSGGTLGYNYSWSDGSTLSTLSNIPTGLYTLFVEDAQVKGGQKPPN